MARLEAKIVKIGVGEDSGVKIKLKDGTKLDGYISSRDENGFDLTVGKGRAVRNVKYTEAEKVQE